MNESVSEIICIDGIVEFVPYGPRVLLEDGRTFPLMGGDGPVHVTADINGIHFGGFGHPPLEVGEGIVAVFDQTERFLFWTLKRWVTRAQHRLSEIRQQQSLADHHGHDWSPGKDTNLELAA